MKDNHHGNNHNKSDGYYSNGGPVLDNPDENSPVSDNVARIQKKVLLGSCSGVKL